MKSKELLPLTLWAVTLLRRFVQYQLNLEDHFFKAIVLVIVVTTPVVLTQPTCGRELRERILQIASRRAGKTQDCCQSGWVQNTLKRSLRKPIFQRFGS